MDLLDEAKKKEAQILSQSDTSDTTPIPDLSMLMNPATTNSSPPLAADTPIDTLPEPPAPPAPEPPPAETSLNELIPPIQESVVYGSLHDQNLDPRLQSPPPQPKKPRHLGIVFAALALLLITLPIIGFFANQQRQIADIRSQAAGSCSGGSLAGKTCAGVSFGPNDRCEGRSENNCKALGSCGCSWNESQPTSGTTTNPTQPPGGGGCAAGDWSCNGNCANSSIQTLFNNTWCNGQAQWLFEAGCGGSQQVAKSQGCPGATQNTQPSGGNVCLAGSAGGCEGKPYGWTGEIPGVGSCMICVQQSTGTCGRQFCDDALNQCLGVCYQDLCSNQNPQLSAAPGVCSDNQFCCNPIGTTTPSTSGSSSSSNSGCTLGDDRCHQGYYQTCQAYYDENNNITSTYWTDLVAGNQGRRPCTLSVITPNGTNNNPNLQNNSSSGTQNNQTNTITSASSCLITSPANLVDGPIAVSAGCPSTVVIKRFERPTNPGSTSESCIGTSSNESTIGAGAGEYYPTGECGRCVQIDTIGLNGQPYGSAKYTGDCTNSPTNPPITNTPVVAQCQNIKIYRNGVVLTTNEYNTIRPGQELTFAVVGTNAQKARFTINNAIPQETDRKNESNEWTLNYTVPAVSVVTNFTIQAEIFGNGQWR